MLFNISVNKYCVDLTNTINTKQVKPRDRSTSITSNSDKHSYYKFTRSQIKNLFFYIFGFSSTLVKYICILNFSQIRQFLEFAKFRPLVVPKLDPIVLKPKFQPFWVRFSKTLMKHVCKLNFSQIRQFKNIWAIFGSQIIP